MSKTSGPCLRIEGRTYVVGLFYDLSSGRVTEAAPYIKRWAIGTHVNYVLAHLRARGPVKVTRFFPRSQPKG